MELYRSAAALEARSAGDATGCVATIGGYDGLHLGHQAILARVRELAAERAAATLVFSFEPLPKEYFAPDEPPARLTRFRERAVLLERMGIDRFFFPRFDGVMQRISRGQFIDMIVRVLKPSVLVVGDDFRFAHRREGRVADLVTAGRGHGFSVEQVGSVYADGERVSSTAVRQALRAGRLEEARRLLGRRYAMCGRVVRGQRLGRTLGFPTANVNLERRASPLGGIFAVRVRGLGPRALDAVASLGTRPTVDGTRPLLEVHIFDFDRDIYGRMIEVEFVARLRDELRFPSLESMTEQMHRDCAEARAILAA
jgi:riboflavin kinase/FMN adenylyltransferase